MPLQTFNPLGLISPESDNLQTIMGKEFENSINRVKSRYAEPKMQADIALSQAQTQNQQRQAQFGNLQGPAAKLFSIRMLEQQLGPDDPTVIQAKEELELERSSQKMTNERNRILNETAYQRQSTPYAKQLFEEREVDAGYAPGTMGSENPIRLTPSQQAEYKAQIAQQRKIKSSDSSARQKELVAENLDQTADLIDVDSLVRYSGLSGGIQKQLEKGKSLTGKDSEAYKQFQENMVRAEIFADQIRNYFGGSITSSMMKRLEELTNPASWTRTPEAAKRNFLALKELLKIESETYKKAANPGKSQTSQVVQSIENQQSNDDPFGIL